MIQCLVGSTARMMREGTGDIAFARADGSPIIQGSRVAVAAINGATAIVRPVTEQEH